MNENITRNSQIDSSVAIKPEKTPLVVGPGIVIKGNVVCETDDADIRMMILGRVEGDITTKGIVQIANGGEIAGLSVIDAGTIIVSGRITGDNVTVRANLLVLQSTGNVAVQKVCLPPGGLEQQRGSVLNARLSMSDEAVEKKLEVDGGASPLRLHPGFKFGQSHTVAHKPDDRRAQTHSAPQAALMSAEG